MKRVALITGGSRGIGFGIAKHLAQNGFDLAVNGVREEKALLTLCRNCVMQELMFYIARVMFH
jgi:NAD(P)-dependent dehydrogenase (short-subunit alcohol dehydrogenase family)